MKYETVAILIAFFGMTSAVPVPEPRNVFVPPRMLRGREVPQEHSHEKILTSVRTLLNKNNPDKIQDPVFGLLGNAAAVVGQGSITNTDCLHQATADQAFTNAKAAGDVDGQVAALQFAALERNTQGVGTASVLCTAIKATNPEIAAISQHQDPASAGAAAINKAIVLELAKQIASVGGDPQLALETGTFTPGDKNDGTGRGNTCDDQDDPIGCIFTKNLLVEDATAAEIDAAVKGVAAAPATPATPATPANTNAPSTGDDTASACPAPTTSVVVVSAGSAAAATPAPAAAAPPAAAPAPAANAGVSTSAVDLGSCSDPTIVFKAGLDGRKENAFIANNQADFNHGSALNIGVIASFICDRLSSSCKASAAAIADCAAGQTAAAAATGQAAADAFNAAFGASAATPATPAGEDAAAPSPSAVELSPPAAAPAAAAPAADTGAASGTNVQKFTGALGGAPPPVIQSSGSRPFSVNGNTFVNSGAALQRSCAIQHNACADAANSGKLAGGVGQCETQEAACNAAA